MKHLSVLIKPASALCNIRCTYCFYADISSLRDVRSFGRMNAETAEKMIENIYCDLEAGDRLTLTFQGGEPTLAGLAYFKQIVSLIQRQAKQVQVEYCLQTNGMIINEQWCVFLKENQFLVGLSIDGYSAFHDRYRLDPKGRGTFQRVLKTKQLFDDYKINYNVLCVLTDALADEPEKIFQFIVEQKIEYIQFIPCLDELEAQTKSDYALSPRSFAYFYKRLLELWLDYLGHKNYVSIKLFDDLLNLLVNHQTTACGILGNCQIQYVIEADGSVYPCDFYVLDKYRLGYIQHQTLRELFEQDLSKLFVSEKPVTSSYCRSCPFFKMCRGGCKRMKDAIYVNEQEEFCGYQEVLKSFVPKIPAILAMLKEAAR
ncbi:radical SAM/SPASM domain-containing protein [Enterococcus florum]|uniref:Radical SAM/SPASM domain-containing protein n=1 Tax=Enterococcus florum TaxID=2480627 RepID=A0A4P5PEU9_9ENTE|nr:SPASM domain-containing protein [Enterococcus florum]GCF94182.1 radical SAM/SPASM domain-containing protein [Enterococcus florum]